MATSSTSSSSSSSSQQKPPIWILNGAPGGGKSTLAERLAKEFNFLHISPGNILRQFENLNTPFGEQIRQARQMGGMPMDKINAKVVIEALSQEASSKQGVFLDGFPVTPGAAYQFEVQSPELFDCIRAVLVFEVDDKVVLYRLGGRRVHLTSGRVYHIVDNPPQFPNKDDISGEPLVIRKDDEESIIRKRIAFHRENTPKVSLFFRQRSIPIHYVNANRTMEEVYQDFKKIINLQHVTKIVTSQPEIPIKVKETVTTHLFGFPSIKTKLICTIGPASLNLPIYESMVVAGMDIARINFAHGHPSLHKKYCELIRETNVKLHSNVSILCDLQGPKIRTGTIQTPCLLTKGNEILVTPDHVQMGNAQKFQIKYPELVSKLDVGSYIMLDHGKIQLQVTQKLERELVCSIIVGGALQSHTTCNFPEQKIDLSGKVFEKDMKDLIHICELKPHYVAVSYVSQPEDIHRVRNVLINHQLSRVKILAKLEHQNSIANMDEIIKVSDGIIIVRGELGIEIESWKVPSIQKKVIQLCHNEGKPVIIDAQMLSQPIPSRAECTDICNAVLDGVDAVMLAGETAVGTYPIEIMKVTSKIITEAEQYLIQIKANLNLTTLPISLSEITSRTIPEIVTQFEKLHYSGKIIVLADTELIVRMVSKARPLMDIYAFTKDPDMVHSLNILWGVRTLNLLLQKSQIEEQSVEAIQFAVSKSLLSKTDHVIIVSNSGHYHQTVSGIDPLMGCTVFIIDLQKLFKDETEYE